MFVISVLCEIGKYTQPLYIVQMSFLTYCFIERLNNGEGAPIVAVKVKPINEERQIKNVNISFIWKA